MTHNKKPSHIIEEIKRKNIHWPGNLEIDAVWAADTIVAIIQFLDEQWEERNPSCNHPEQGKDLKCTTCDLYLPTQD